MSISDDEREELKQLRQFKLEHEGKALNRAFARLDVLANSSHDPLISIRAFNVIVDCLVTLKDEIGK